jgi:hypothetical protein
MNPPKLAIARLYIKWLYLATNLFQFDERGLHSHEIQLLVTAVHLHFTREVGYVHHVEKKVCVSERRLRLPVLPRQIYVRFALGKCA